MLVHFYNPFHTENTMYINIYLQIFHRNSVICFVLFFFINMSIRVLCIVQKNEEEEEEKKE